MKRIKEVLNISDDAVLSKLVSLSEKVCFKKNDMILNIGSSQDFVYLILKGIVRSYYLDIDGNDITKAFMQENEFCVGESLFEDGPSIQGFEALEDVETLKFKAADFKEIILADSGLTGTYIDFLEKNLIYKMERESSFQIMSAKERYMAFHRDFETVESRVNQSYIASYLGVAPESLSRIKRTIKKDY